MSEFTALGTTRSFPVVLPPFLPLVALHSFYGPRRWNEPMQGFDLDLLSSGSGRALPCQTSQEPLGVLTSQMEFASLTGASELALFWLKFEFHK